MLHSSYLWMNHVYTFMSLYGVSEIFFEIYSLLCGCFDPAWPCIAVSPALRITVAVDNLCQNSPVDRSPVCRLRAKVASNSTENQTFFSCQLYMLQFSSGDTYRDNPSYGLKSSAAVFGSEQQPALLLIKIILTSYPIPCLLSPNSNVCVLFFFWQRMINSRYSMIRWPTRMHVLWGAQVYARTLPFRILLAYLGFNHRMAHWSSSHICARNTLSMIL